MKHQLLLVVQNIDRRQALYNRLNREGFTILTAPSGETALHALEYERPDLILLDPALTDMPAAELLKRIRGFEKNVPVLLLDICDAELNRGDQIPLPPSITEEALLAVINLSLAVSPYRPVQSHCPKNILVVDDEARMRAITQRILELNGFTVEIAPSGEVALSLLSTLKMDAVVLDIRMAGMDGIVVLKKIRDHYPQLPVIMMTHADEDATREEAKRLGARGYLTKPVNFDELKQLLNAVVPKINSPANTKSPTSSANGSGSSG